MTGRPPKILDEAQERRLIAAVKAREVPLDEIARRFQIRRGNIAAILEKHGIDLKRRA